MKKRYLRYADLRKILIGLGLLVLILSLSIYLHNHRELIRDLLESEGKLVDVTGQLRRRTPLNFLILMLLTSSMAAVPFMSNAPFAVFNGVVYGPLIVFLMNLTSNVLGNFLFIKIIEKIDLGDYDSKLKGHLDELRSYQNRDLGLIFGYMLPIFPTVVLNYAISKMKTPWRNWLICASLGVLPTSLIYALGGDAIIAGNIKRLLILLSIVVLAYLLVMLFKKRKKEK